MRIVRIVFRTVVLLVLASLAGVAVAWLATAPEPLPEGSESARRLAAGPRPVGRRDLEWVDRSRPTQAYGGYPGAPERTFPVKLWYPEGASGPHALVVYSHGFVSTRHAGTYLAEHLASHGYVVLAADYPLTHLQAPDGGYADDVVHQPGDVSFLIDRALALVAPERPFDGDLDSERIGLVGHSLGGATTTLAAFHPRWRDARVRAAISVAGPGDVFGARFFDAAPVPFLMIAGTADAIVDYPSNAGPIPDRIGEGGLVTLAGGTHIGFAQFASGVFRIFGSPDAVGCWLGGADPDAVVEHPFSGLFGTPEEGLLEATDYPTPCVATFVETLAAGRQQALTTLAVRAFFDRYLAPENDARADAAEFLVRTLPAEIPEVTYAPARR